MKVALSLLLAVMIGFSTTIWSTVPQWPAAVLLQVALVVGIVVNRHMFAGLVLGVADAGHALGAMRAVEHQPTAGLLGGAAADAVRRGTRNLMLSGRWSGGLVRTGAAPKPSKVTSPNPPSPLGPPSPPDAGSTPSAGAARPKRVQLVRSRFGQSAREGT